MVSCNFEHWLINCSSGFELEINGFFPIPLDLGKELLQGRGKLSTFAMGTGCAVWSAKKEEVIFCQIPLPLQTGRTPVTHHLLSTLRVTHQLPHSFPAQTSFHSIDLFLSFLF